MDTGSKADEDHEEQDVMADRSRFPIDPSAPFMGHFERVVKRLKETGRDSRRAEILAREEKEQRDQIRAKITKGRV